MNKLKKLSCVFAYIIIIIAVLLFTILRNIPAPDEEEIQRVTSPDGLLDAVLVERLTHATVPTPTLIYIVGAGSSFEKSSYSLFCDHAENLKVKWHQSRQLEISFTKIRITFFESTKKIAHPKGEYSVDLNLQHIQD